MLFGSIEIIVVLLLIIVNGLFAMSEFAVISARKTRLQKLAEDGDRNAEIALELAGSPNKFLSTVQVGITLVGVLSGAFGGATIAHRMAGYLDRIPFIAPYSEAVSLGVVVCIITYFSLIAELVPKRIALAYPERIASMTAVPMRMLSVVASPVIRVLSATTDLILKLSDIHPSSDPQVTEEEIRVIIDQATIAGVLEETEHDMVERIFRLGDRRAGALMVPRRQIEWLDIGASPDEIRRKMEESPFSRFPVCRNSISNVLGVAHVKDLLKRSLSGRSLELRACLQQPLFVVESMKAFRVLELFRKTRTGMALVIDEYGTIEGLVTLNDVMEAIVGDIPSAETVEEPRVVQREDGSWFVDGMLPADEVKRLLHIRKLPGEEGGNYETLGGFLMMGLKRIPSEGDHFDCCGFRFEVADMDANRVDKVFVIPLGKTSGEEEDDG